MARHELSYGVCRDVLLGSGEQPALQLFDAVSDRRSARLLAGFLDEIFS
jgi:hypothetical protein